MQINKAETSFLSSSATKTFQEGNIRTQKSDMTINNLYLVGFLEEFYQLYALTMQILSEAGKFMP